MTVRLDRVHHTIGRAAEYFSASELEKQTGQPRQAFATMALKELVDNALDAAESAGVAPEIAIAASRTDGELRLSVADNGPGLSAEVIGRILDFSSRTSDKLAYRAPTRGMQGNALKSLVGLATALGGDAPLIIESQGQRHEIRAGVNPIGEAAIAHVRREQPTAVGATVSLAIPAVGQGFDPARWAQSFALLNPHARISVKSWGFADGGNVVAQIGEHADAEQTDFYQSLVAFPDGWRKWLPSEPTSPHWYDATSLQTLLYGLPPELPLRDFVRQFAGLTATAKAKAIVDQVPGCKRLADLRDDAAAIARLLDAMQHEARPVPPKALGLIGEATIRARFAACYGLAADRFWYAKALDTDRHGVPFALEVALAETERPGSVVYGLNFSPAFGDPLADAWFGGGKITQAHGVAGFLGTAHVVAPYWGEDNVAPPVTAALVHIVSPRLTTLDRGKSRLAADAMLINALGDALWKAAKPLYEDGERRRKDAAKQERVEQARRHAVAKVARDQKWTLAEAAFEVMEQAWAQATGAGAQPASARTVFYQARPLMQDYTDEVITDTYFTQTLLPKYQREVRDLPNVYYEPRGTLHEPHTDQMVPLGTREVEAYRIPEWTYNKILFIEKKGLWPPLEAAQLAERFDMAIVAGEGFATEAARRLLQRADKTRTMQLFVVHDADPSGYNIARTLAEETARMPGYKVEVIDLGLRFEDGLAMGLGTETFTRKKQLPKAMAAKLTEREREAFVGRRAIGPDGKDSWLCERIELNAMSSPQLIQFIEDGLARHGATAKIVPPQKLVQFEAWAGAEQRLHAITRREVERRLDLDGLVSRVTDGAVARRLVGEARDAVTAEVIRTVLERDRTLWWKNVAYAEGDARLGGAEPHIIAVVDDLLRRRQAARLRRWP